MGCALHDEAFTHGCPGCLDYIDDFVTAVQIKERMAADTGERLSLEEVCGQMGMSWIMRDWVWEE